MRREDDTFADLKPLFVQAAQKEYDDWAQDEDGMDEVLGTGGICQDIAEKIASILSQHGFDCTTVSQQIGEQHVYVIAKTEDGVYEVDIPPYVYETGGGYNWRKIPNVKFDESCISVNRLSSDPEEFEQYGGDGW